MALVAGAASPKNCLSFGFQRWPSDDPGDKASSSPPSPSAPQNSSNCYSISSLVASLSFSPCLLQASHLHCATFIVISSSSGSAPTFDLSASQRMSVHGSYVKCGLIHNVVVENDLLTMYIRCRCVEFASQLFDEMLERALITWVCICLELPKLRTLFGACWSTRSSGDGAAQIGKMLFARQGKKFDYDFKQLRFSGDLLIELGAGVKLATAVVPHLCLPLACAANVMKILKNVAAITSASTRAPKYIKHLPRVKT